MEFEEWTIETSREWIVAKYSEDYNRYQGLPLTARGGFDELLCWEIHTNEQTFNWLAKKWDISVAFLGELIADHCNRL